MGGHSVQVEVDDQSTQDQLRYTLNAEGRVAEISGHLEGDSLYADLNGHRRRIAVADLGDHFVMYTYSTDVCAGGRLAFDHKGHLFLSIGCKGPGFYPGIQDLSKPYGKIFRINDDGSLPTDNPVFEDPSALAGIYTVGHRTPLGLEVNLATGDLWGVEQGPMGGDELNHLVPGGNFGWPLTSKGLHYDSKPVDKGPELGIQWTMEDIEQPALDFTPSPALSSLTIYTGDQFPQWKNNIFVTSLKAQELFRVVIDEANRVTRKESIFKGFGRIRDIEVGNDGALYLLLENVSEGQVIRLVNADI